VTAFTGAGFQPFGFAGGLYDANMGLLRFGARGYDSKLGAPPPPQLRRFDEHGRIVWHPAANAFVAVQ